MTTKQQIPGQLSVVAYIFLFTGITALFDMSGQGMRGVMGFNFNLLGLGVFFGLRRYLSGWRTVALVCIWAGFVGLAIAFIYGFYGSGPAFIQFFGRRVVTTSSVWLSVVAATVFPLYLWMYRVLTRPAIRCLFYGTLPLSAV